MSLTLSNSWQLAISLPQQIENYRAWQNKVVGMVGRARANEIFSGAVQLLSAGSSDFIQNYYINLPLRGAYSIDRFSDMLLKSFTNFVEVCCCTHYHCLLLLNELTILNSKIIN